MCYNVLIYILKGEAGMISVAKRIYENLIRFSCKKLIKDIEEKNRIQFDEYLRAARSGEQYILSRRFRDFLEGLVVHEDAVLKTLRSKRKRMIVHEILGEQRKEFSREVQEANKFCLQKQKEIYSDFFKNKLGGKILSNEQTNAVLLDDSVVLVNAAAGSGKTGVISAKVGHLIRNMGVSPKKILLLTFSNKAASEMQERLGKIGGEGLKIKTLHAFGLELYQKAVGYSPQIFPGAETQKESDRIFSNLIHSFSKDFCQDEEFRKEVTFFFQYLQHEGKPLWEIKSFEEYCAIKRRARSLYVSPFVLNRYGDDQVQSASIKTLSGVKVRSYEEKLIADILYLNGVKFEYEKYYPHRRNYRPDFYLIDKGIYLEHFGIDRDGNVPSFFTSRKRGGDASKEYNESIEWKRSLHKKKGTTLIETYSYDVSEGVLEERLISMLETHGYVLEPIDDVALVGRLLGELGAIIKKSINSLKLSGLQPCDIRAKILAQRKSHKKNRDLGLFSICSKYFIAYEKFLTDSGQVDFSDLLIAGQNYYDEALSDERFLFDYIIVDEFQDTSNLSIAFIDSMWKRNKKSRLFFVGDDWQSIYGFNGSDYTLMSGIKKIYPDAAELPLGTNYRSTPGIVSLGERFIKKNPAQTQKMTRDDGKKEDREILFLNSEEINDYLKKIMKGRQGKPPSVYFLCRFNDDITFWKEKIDVSPLVSSALKGEDLQKAVDALFSTIHGSKGGQAEFVIILPSTRGIPSPINDDPFLGHYNQVNDSYPHSEERRIFYVAITRAEKNLVFVEHGNFSQQNELFWEEVKGILGKRDFLPSNRNLSSLEEDRCLSRLLVDDPWDNYKTFVKIEDSIKDCEAIHGRVEIRGEEYPILIYRNTGLFIFLGKKPSKDMLKRLKLDRNNSYGVIDLIMMQRGVEINQAKRIFARMSGL